MRSCSTWVPLRTSCRRKLKAATRDGSARGAARRWAVIHNSFATVTVIRAVAPRVDRSPMLRLVSAEPSQPVAANAVARDADDNRTA